MIKLNQQGQPNFIPASRILKEIQFLHKETPAFCYGWIWEAKCVTALEKDDFAESIQELKAVGCVRRCEVYAREPLQMGKTKYYVRLVSYGAPNTKKMFLGPSHLAHAFDKLLYDYVYVFLEKEATAIRKSGLILNKLKEKQNHKKIEQIKKSMRDLLNMSEEQIENV